MTTQTIAITTGEPAGIGAEISLRAAHEWTGDAHTKLVLLGDHEFLCQTAHNMGLDAPICKDTEPAPPPNALIVHDIKLAAPVEAGLLEPKNAQYVLNLLDVAVEGIQKGTYAAMVTAPIQKSIINEAGCLARPFSGHTEYLAEQTNTPKVVMMLSGAGMRVALASTHLALKDVPAVITHAALVSTIDIILHDLHHHFGIKKPHLLVTGLNPHAGENGHMGREELEIIAPVIAQFQQRGINVTGPYPADTVFQPRYLNTADAVLAMYHDQGLAVLKYASFGRGVNITLGLPIIRTSVDHGTALNLAGKNQADAGSMLAAIDCAHEMVQRRHSSFINREPS